MTTEIELQDQDSEYEAREQLPQANGQEYEPYRSMSKASAISLALAILSITGLLFPALLGAAATAIGLGLVGLRNVRRYPNELTGRKIAITGIVLGLVLLAGGTALHSYIYMTEVPDGYQRISFEQLQPARGDQHTDPGGLPFDLDGKRVFVKGYVHPGVSDMGEIKKFILVPDMGTCCFGGQPKLTDMIEVTIKGRHGVKYAPRKRKLAGVFHVNNRIKQVIGGLQGGLYALDAEYVR